VSVSEPSCPDHLFSEELGDVEINTQIHKVLAHGADLIPRASPASLREGVDNTRVSPYGSIFWLFVQFHPLTVLMFLHRMLGTLTACHKGSPCQRTWRSER
jgi:hypothetical protein